jgi:hypothetical protein
VKVVGALYREESRSELKSWMLRVNLGVHASWQQPAGELLLGDLYAVKVESGQITLECSCFFGGVAVIQALVYGCAVAFLDQRWMLGDTLVPIRCFTVTPELPASE